MRHALKIIFILLSFSASVQAQTWEELNSKAIEYYQVGNYDKAIEFGLKAFETAK